MKLLLNIKHLFQQLINMLLGMYICIYIYIKHMQGVTVIYKESKFSYKLYNVNYTDVMYMCLWHLTLILS